VRLLQRTLALRDAFALPPAWVADAVVYQVFPDRFRRGDRPQPPLAWMPWGSDPALQGFQGGDLWGVCDALDYLQDLGVSCLYLTPIFSSAANHRYHAYDYLQVDPLLGGDAAFDALLAEVHRRGMRMILDGVFNHCGRGFWAFHHLLENGERSPYRDWFHVHGWPLRAYPSEGEACGYSCWWNDPALPKFNHRHPPVHDYLLQVGRHWLERGIDRWRLDVPDEVPSSFWIAFRRMARAVNPEAWIVGEIWGDARAWLAGDQFDGVMNYRLGWSSLCWAAAGRLDQTYANPHYPLQPLETDALLSIWHDCTNTGRLEVNRGQLNLLDSHDVPRALHTLQGDTNALALALVLVVFQLGAPCLYYGTEMGLQGGAEPGCREAMPWDHPLPQPLHGTIRALLALRSRLPELRQCGLRWRSLGRDGLIGEGPGLCVLLNRSRRQPLNLAAVLPMGVEISGDLSNTLVVGAPDTSLSHLAPQSALLISRAAA